jgi:hypothetical protein
MKNGSNVIIIWWIYWKWCYKYLMVLHTVTKALLFWNEKLLFTKNLEIWELSLKAYLHFDSMKIQYIKCFKSFEQNFADNIYGILLHPIFALMNNLVGVHFIKTHL